MKLNPAETQFLTALIREQNQCGCRGPAHDLLRRHVYPDAPRTGPGSLKFAYDAVPLSSMLLQDFTDLRSLDDFLRTSERIFDVRWPWPSADAYRAQLDQARRDWAARRAVAPLPVTPAAATRTKATSE
jgi:hypothetical protein